MTSPTKLLHSLFDTAVASAQPAQCVPSHLPEPPKGRTLVIGAGKASAEMARAMEQNWPGELEGLVLTRYGHAVPCERIEIVEAAHPVPDEAGQQAAVRMLERVQGLSPDDLVVCLISGGGSALLALPAPGLTLEDKQAVNRELLRSGATIHEMNCVRKHLSAIKGGRLAAACHPARVLTLAISDVPGDELSVIASGPTVPDESTFAQARAVLEKYGIEVPSSVQTHLERAEDETPKPGDARLANTETKLIAAPQQMLEAVAAQVREAGLTPLILSDRIEGETRDVAKVHAAIARQIQTHGQPVSAPAAILSGGETTVTVRGKGKGGRNSEFVLALLDDLRGLPGISALACDTDGIDGSEDNAGAVLTPETFSRAESLGLAPAEFLSRNDAYSFFQQVDGLVVSGPSLTNVNDFRAILVEPA
ncbi:MAG: glycerate kinase [SAR324 cluster bacterium]|nr:glycerate kinase [SAR324 cluster bacterium]